MISKDLVYGSIFTARQPPFPEHQTSDLGPPGSSPCLPLVTSGGDHWRPIQLFRLVHLGPSPIGTAGGGATETEARTVSMRAIRILLECFLVYNIST